MFLPALGLGTAEVNSSAVFPVLLHDSEQGDGGKICCTWTACSSLSVNDILAPQMIDGLDILFFFYLLVKPELL